MRKRWHFAVAAILALIIAPTVAPELLAFPYRAQSQGSQIWSEAPMPKAELDKVLRRSAALVAQSPIAQRVEPRRIFLTHGGWRWTWLAMRNRGAFAVSRALRDTVVINRNDLGEDHVWNGQSLGGQRTLSGAIAHETCHGVLRHHFGMTVDVSAPTWLREGYCDHVAQESSLSHKDVAALKAKGEDHPALIYYEGRKRVASELRANGGSVDALFAARR